MVLPGKRKIERILWMDWRQVGMGSEGVNHGVGEIEGERSVRETGIGKRLGEDKERT